MLSVIKIPRAKKAILKTARMTGGPDHCKQTTAILDFRLPPMSDNIVFSAIEFGIFKNVVVALGISILSCLQIEIHAVPV